MFCQECRQRAATVHMTKIINGQKSETHLCETCAREKGQVELMLEPGFDIHNLLAGLLNQEGFAPTRGLFSSPEPNCPVCGMTYRGFAETGRLGCSQCYDHLEGQLIPLIRRIHGTTHHTGKVPRRAGGVVRLRKELAQLKDELQRAVNKEEFERAAHIRDKIKDLERKVKAGGELDVVE